MVPPADKPASDRNALPESSSTAESQPASEDVSVPEPSRDTEPTHDTLKDADVATTDLSVQSRTDPTLLSHAEPAGGVDNQLSERIRELELKQDALLARVRLLEKGGENAMPRPGVWLLFLPLVAFLWWLVQRLG